MKINTGSKELNDLLKNVLNDQNIDGAKQLFSINANEIESVTLNEEGQVDLSNKKIVAMQLMLYGDLTQKKIAELIGKDPSCISYWKNHHDKFRRIYSIMNFAEATGEQVSTTEIAKL